MTTLKKPNTIQTTKLEGTIKDSQVYLIILDNKPRAIHFKLENKLLIYAPRGSLYASERDSIFDKSWDPERVYISRDNFTQALHKFKADID